MAIGSTEGQFALDLQGLTELRYRAKRDSEGALKETAKQFEALFIQSMLKSMRDAIPKSDLLGSSQTDLYESLMDQQWSQQLASRGIGLADQLVASLSRQKQLTEKINDAGALLSATQVATKNLRGSAPPMLASLQAGGRLERHSGVQQVSQSFLEEEQQKPVVSGSDVSQVDRADDLLGSSELNDTELDGAELSGSEFLELLKQPAIEASRVSGVPAELILAQAALETGWGKHQITTAEGSNSYNLFGIKASGNWEGRTTTVTTHEYIEGERRVVSDKFRVYDSYEQAFTDYATLISSNSRYSAVLTAKDAEQAARALQEGGYATDPRYAEKLIAVMNQNRVKLTSS